MKNLPKVSIIMRTRDRSRFLRRAMESLVGQEFRDFELVLIGKAGCLSEAEVISREVVGERYEVVPCEVEGDEPLGALLNRGIEVASGDYVLPLDDDDTLVPECLEVLVASLEEALELDGFAGVVCQSHMVEEEVTADGEIRELSRREFNDDLLQVVITDILSVNRFTIHSFMYVKDAWKALGGYNEKIALAEDWDFNTRFILDYNVSVVPQVLNAYHIRRQADNREEGNTQTLSLMLHRNVATAELNRRIRAYLDDGDRIGELTAHALVGLEQEYKIKKLRSLLKTVGRKIGQIDDRTLFMKKEVTRFLAARERRRKRAWFRRLFAARQ